MRNFDAEIARLEERKADIRKAKAFAQRRCNEKVGKEVRELFPNLPDDPSRLRDFFVGLGAIPVKDVQASEKKFE